VRSSSSRQPLEAGLIFFWVPHHAVTDCIPSHLNDAQLIHPVACSDQSVLTDTYGNANIASTKGSFGVSSM
jgi:hypothetical protein